MPPALPEAQEGPIDLVGLLLSSWVSDVMGQRLHRWRCENSLQIRIETRCDAAGFATSRHATTRYDFVRCIHPRRKHHRQALMGT